MQEFFERNNQYRFMWLSLKRKEHDGKNKVVLLQYFLFI